MRDENFVIAKHTNITSISVGDKFVTYGGVVVECKYINYEKKMLTYVSSKFPIEFNDGHGNFILRDDIKVFIYILPNLHINVYSREIFGPFSSYDIPTHDISSFNLHLNIQYKLETLKQKIDLI